MSVIFTTEERMLDEQDTLSMLKEGRSQRNIAKELGRSTQYITNIKKRLIEKGLITDEEIEQYRLLAIDNKVLGVIKSQSSIRTIAKECGISITAAGDSIKRLLATNRLPEGFIVDGNEAKKRIKEKQKAMILERLLQGNINTKQILQEFGIGETTLYRYVNELINENRLSREIWENKNNENSEADPEKERQVLELLYSGQYTKYEIASIAGVYLKYVIWVSENLLDKSKVSRKEKASPIQSEEVQKKIIENLKKGFTYKYIAHILGITSSELTATIRALKKSNQITQKQIELARQERIEQDKKMILTYLRRGYNYREIAYEVEGLFGKTYIIELASKLMEEGYITPEQYERYKEEAPQGPEDIALFVLEQLREGKSYKEIMDADISGYLSIHRIKTAKELLVNSGRVTEKEIEQWYQDRLKRQYKFIDSIVLRAFREGKTIPEIEKLEDSSLLTEGRVRESKKRLIASGKITEKEIAKYKKQREEKKKKFLDKFVLRQLRLGKTIEEIFRGYSREPITKKDVILSRKKLLDSKRISLNQISQARKQRNFENFKMRASKSNSPVNFENELIAMLKHGFLIEEVATYFKLSLSRMYRYITPTIQKYNITYGDIKKYRMQAKIDYEELKSKAKEYDSISSQISFFELLTFYSDHGRLISNEDLHIFENSILFNPRLLSADNLKLIIMQYIKGNNFFQATRFINDCLSLYGETQYAASLKKFKAEIDVQARKRQIQDLAKKGYSAAQIARELKIFEIDVINILKDMKDVGNNGSPGGRD